MITFFYVLLLIIIVLIGCIGFAATFIMMSIRIKTIFLLTIVSMIFTFLVIVVLTFLLEKHVKADVSILRVLTFSGLVCIISTVFLILTLFKPLPGAIFEKTLPENSSYLTLDNGSEIAFWHYKGNKKGDKTPILFVHGGPGAHVRDIDRDYFESLSKEGYDVFLYDQPGGGFSENLELSEYSMERCLKDIEFIRNYLGVDKLVLVGQSFGALICSSYAAEYTDYVEAIMFTSPGELRPPSVKDRYQEKVDIDESGIKYASENLYKFKPTLSESIRFATAILMCQVGGEKAAENLVSQHEIKEYSTRLIPEAIGMSYHIKYTEHVPNIKSGGINLHVTTVMKNEYKAISETIIKTLSTVKFPVLILRSEYDYVNWEATRYYKEVFKNSYLVYISESGHIPWSINIADTYSAMIDFLDKNYNELGIYSSQSNPYKNNELE